MSTSNNNLNDSYLSGIVIKKNSGQFHVLSDGREITCQSRITSERIALGEEVGVQLLEGHTGVIIEVLPRRNKLSRRAAVPMPGAHAGEQVIAANIDQVVPVFAAAEPAPKWNMLDRYLVSAEAAGIPALIIITKVDLIRNGKRNTAADLESALEVYRRIGYSVVLVSAHSREGLDRIKDALNGRISLLVGKSGVGKSSLLNAIQPGLGLRVNAVNAVTGKGRHTTTHLEMFPLANGGAIIDTPGVREYGLWDIQANDLAMYFPEMRRLVGRCRFRLDCRHDEEPGCAIRSAVMSGQIDPRRYQSFMRLKEEV